MASLVAALFISYVPIPVATIPKLGRVLDTVPIDQRKAKNVEAIVVCFDQMLKVVSNIFTPAEQVVGTDHSVIGIVSVRHNALRTKVL